MSKPKLVIADDHKLILDGICGIFESVPDLEIVGTALNGRQLISVVAESDPDMVLTDLNMPGLDGLEVVEILKERFPHIRILVLSTYSNPELIKRIVDLGGDGYLLKEHGGTEVIDAVRTILSGESYFDENLKNGVAQNGLFKEDFLVKQSLTEREKEILKLIAASNSNREIGEKLFISEHTVKTHRRNLKRKLNANNTADLVKFALENGIA